MEVATWDTGCSGKEQALKVLEEAAETFSIVERFEQGFVPLFAERDNIGDEIADVITAACNLARMYGIDVDAAMRRCEERNRERCRL